MDEDVRALVANTAKLQTEKLDSVVRLIDHAIQQAAIARAIRDDSITHTALNSLISHTSDLERLTKELIDIFEARVEFASLATGIEIDDFDPERDPAGVLALLTQALNNTIALYHRVEISFAEHSLEEACQALKSEALALKASWESIAQDFNDAAGSGPICG